MSEMSESAESMLALTSEIVAAYVGNNDVPRADLSSVIAETYFALTNLQRPQAAAATPAVAVRKSVTADYLISLEDGRRYRSLRRHLAGLGMTPEQYRQKWDLAADYPMVAANYSKRRSELARAMGLGRKPGSEQQAASDGEAPADAQKRKRS